MNRTSKILSLVLLLAALVSAFGVFAAFAEDEGSKIEPVTIFDLEESYDKNAGTKGYWAELDCEFTDGTDNTMIYPNFQEKTRPGDTTRWFNYGFDGWDQTVAYPSNYNSSSTNHIVEINPAVNPKLSDHANGTYVRDTDFLVFDFDYAVSESMMDNLLFNMRYYRQDTGKTLSGGLTSVELSKNPEGNNFSFTMKGNTYYTKSNSDGWVNITLIVDAARYDGSDKVYMYVYIDGIYVGYNYSTGAGYFDFCRMQAEVNVGETPTTPNQAASLANFTIKQFPKGYEGALADYSKKGILDSLGTPIDAIPELAYCLSGTPSNTKVADVHDSEGNLRFEAYTVAELDANLKDGDVVTLYKEITTTLLVPTAANITWVDNGLGIPATVEFDIASYDWVARKRDGTLANATEGFGKQVYSAELSDTVGIEDVTITTDTLAAYFKANVSSDNYFTILNDIQTTSGGAKSLKHVVYDLNGNTWYFKSSTKYAENNGIALNIRNGELIIAAQFLSAAAGQTNTIVIFDDLDVRILATPSDYRSGAIVYDGCVVDGGVDADGKRVGATATLGSFRSNSNNLVVGAIRNSDVFVKDGSGSYVFNISNTAKSGDGRYNSASVAFSTIDSTTKSRYTFSSEIYSCTASTIVDNYNYVTYNAYNSDITANHRMFYVVLRDYTTRAAFKGTATTDAEKYPDTMIVENNYFIEKCKINAAGLNDDTQPTKSTIQAGIDLGKTYEYTTNISVKDTEYAIPSDGAYALLYNPTGRELGQINLNILGYLKVNTKSLVRPGNPTSNVTVDYNGAKLVNSNDEIYPYIYTANYDTYTYQLGTQAPVEFYWNKGETANIDRAAPALAKATDLYYYTWEEVDGAYTAKLNKNFTFGVNLTLREDININIFLPEAVNPAEIGLKVDGADVEFEVFEGQNKIVIKNVDPTAADVVYTITGAVAGAYGDSAPVLGTISVLDYIAAAYNQDADLFQAVVNYLVAASTKANDVVDLPDGLAATEVAKPAYDGAKAPEVDDVITGVSMIVDDGFEWVIKTGATVVKATYTVNGNKLENVEVAVKDGKAVLAINAKDVLEDVTVTVGDKTVTFNYAWYAPAAAAEDASFATLLDAIYAYAYEAAN